MSRRDSSERMAFLRREIARIEGGGPARLSVRPVPARSRSAPALLMPERLAGELHEIMPASAPDVFAALGLALNLCAACARARPRAGVVLAVEDFVVSETGAPYGPGLVETGLDPDRLLIVRTQGPRETLRVMEEALKCPGVCVALGESALDDRLYSLDASRRLAFAARAGGSVGLLAPIALAGAGARLSSAATTRVEVERRSSNVEVFGGSRFGLPGRPVAALRILKARGAFGVDVEKVHEVAFDAFSVDLPSLPPNRPFEAGSLRASA